MLSYSSAEDESASDFEDNIEDDDDDEVDDGEDEDENEYKAWQIDDDYDEPTPKLISKKKKSPQKERYIEPDSYTPEWISSKTNKGSVSHYTKAPLKMEKKTTHSVKPILPNIVPKATAKHSFSYLFEE